MDPPLDVLIARYVLGGIQSWDVPAIADAWLSQGTYSDSIAHLAAVREPTWDSVRPLLLTAVSELGASIPSRADAVKLLLRHHSKRILAGAEPIAALEAMYVDIGSEVHGFSTHVIGDQIGASELLGMYYSIEDIGYLPPLDQPKVLEEIRNGARAAAATFLAQEGTA